MNAAFAVDHRHFVVAHLAGTARVEGGFGVVAHELVQLFVGLAFDARADFTTAILVQRRLVHDLAGDADRVAELLPVLLVGHVVEQDRRMLVRIARLDAHVAAARGAHGSNVALKTMLFHRVRAVVVNRHRQEVILNVRPLELLAAADKPACFEVVARAHARAAKQPLRANLRLVPPLQGRVEGDRLLTFILKIHLQVILQVFTHPG